MKVRILPVGIEDEARADRLAAYVQRAWEAPVTEANFYQFLAFMWLLARAHERMMQFWRYGNNPPN